MAFHFPVMPRMFMALRMEDRYPIVDILQQTPPIPETAQWAIFLRNHDELTLEMVTDEERDYMYRVYAADKDQRINVGIRRRLAPLLGDDRRRIELLNGLLFSLPGTPVLYYGDEIGMGDNFYLGDRNGVRTPMQWSADKNAGFSRANPQRLYLPVIVDPQYHYEGGQRRGAGGQHPLAALVDAADHRPAQAPSGLQPRHPEFLQPENHRVLAFLRRFGDETLLVVANLSRFAQPAALDLSGLEGLTPVELFGRTPFPRIGAAGWCLTLGPHAFLWFSLVAEPATLGRARQVASSSPETTTPPPVLAVAGAWKNVLAGAARRDLEAALLDALPSRRWFAGSARSLRGMEIVEIVPLDTGAVLTIVRAAFADGEAEAYSVPLAFASTAEAWQVVARLESPTPEDSGVLFDPIGDAALGRLLLAAFERGERFRAASGRGELVATVSTVFAELRGTGDLDPTPLRAEPGNSSVRFGDRLILKLFRRLEPGINPDLEIGRFLTEETDFKHVPRVAGWMELRERPAEPVVVAMLQELVPNEGDAWAYTHEASAATSCA